MLDSVKYAGKQIGGKIRCVGLKLKQVDWAHHPADLGKGIVVEGLIELMKAMF